ncbi:MAG: sulfurtransferase [Acidobacteria bacterium 13_1_40CM_2_60_7]|nr:MAG: sulfurtransferase [Acidobacteria bacterium 13_1_40CM_4_61_5]OLD62781.1 MAG: sulfurtransferase [Acidobacteria bacterium 13_1_40CM_2_60_7]PYU04940.1 MAG: sulfurtransferase [Acidobacteriota bacterium]
MSDYAHPEVLVSTEWVAARSKDPGIRLVEVDVDTTSYDQGHIPGALAWNWQTELQDAIRRDLAEPRAFEELLGKAGISPDTTIVLYGDNNNWFAAWAFWQLKYYGHEKALIMNGGRKKWLEEKRPLTAEKPSYPATTYKVKTSNASIRAKRDHVFAALDNRTAKLVDVRSVDEYTGKIIAPPGMTETAQRAGHIPGAANIPWSQAVNEDGTFKSADALKQLYSSKGITGDTEVIAYCRIGERSSHTWFVLKYLLGFEKVRNYDGSWTEWGNLIGAPIEKEVKAATAG